MSVIFTHDGKAHMDEFLACAIIKFALREQEQFKVIRTKETTIFNLAAIKGSEVTDEDFLVDMGKSYNPNVRLFDHHQDDDAVRGECAASLVAKALCPQILEDGLWSALIARVTYQDNNGINAVKTKYGISSIESFMPPEWWLLNWFERDPDAASDFVSYELENRQVFLSGVKRAKEFLSKEENAEICNMPTGEKFLFVKTIDKTFCTKELNAAQGSFIEKHNLIACIGFSDRDTHARTLFLTREGEKSFDLTKIKDVPGITYVHHSGFLANFVPKGDNDHIEHFIMGLLEAARKK